MAQSAVGIRLGVRVGIGMNQVPTMVIRSATADDFDAIAELTNYFIRETAIHFGESPVSAEELRESWQSSRDRFPFLVAEQEGAAPIPKFLGFAKATPWRARSAYRFTAEVGIYLVADAQRRGLGTTLYKALIESCREAGFHAIIGGLTVPNEASERLHRRVGFEPIGVFPEVGFKFDRWHGVSFWQLILTPTT